MKENLKEAKAGKKTMIGMLWMIFATGVGKLATLFTQVVLGWVLTKEDFGLYALALSVATSVSLLRNGGTQQILIQKGTDYAKLAPSIFKFSLIFNFVACIILILISPIAAKLYQAPELQIMLSLIAVSIVLFTPYGLLQAKLVIEHRFKEISMIGLISSIIRQGSTVICAIFGLGYMSFIWPILLEPIVLFFLSFYFVREWFKANKLTLFIFKRIFSDAKWVMLGSLAIALSTSGQYFMIGLFESKESLGIYFFGFQLILVVSVIITTAIETVFLPVLTRLSINKYRIAYVNTLFFICFISLIISVVGFINVEWIVGFVWKGKWNEAVFIVQVLILTMPAILLTNFNKVVMESKGFWGKRLTNLAVFVIGDIIVAGISAWKYDIYYTAMMVCCYRNVFAFFQCIWMARIVKVSLKKIFSSIVPNVFLIILISMILSLTINYFNYINIDDYSNKVLTSILIVFLFMIFNLFFEKNKINYFMLMRK